MTWTALHRKARSPESPLAAPVRRPSDPTDGPREKALAGSRCSTGGRAASRVNDADHRWRVGIDELNHRLKPETADEFHQPALIDHRDIEAFALAADIHPDPARHDASISGGDCLIQLTTGGHDGEENVGSVSSITRDRHAERERRAITGE